jgi:predicted DCC family thiol-disulfide oxidoreductase YuxK
MAFGAIGALTVTSNHDQRCTVVFDGVCVFCNGWVRFVLNRDHKHRIFFTNMQSETGQKILGHAGLDLSKADTLIYLREGTLYTKSTAIIRILADLGRAWRISTVLLLIPRPVRDFFYSAFARRRYALFGQLDRCQRPPPDHVKQFLN